MRLRALPRRSPQTRRKDEQRERGARRGEARAHRGRVRDALPARTNRRAAAVSARIGARVALSAIACSDCVRAALAGGSVAGSGRSTSDFAATVCDLVRCGAVTWTSSGPTHSDHRRFHVSVGAIHIHTHNLSSAPRTTTSSHASTTCLAFTAPASGAAQRAALASLPTPALWLPPDAAPLLRIRSLHAAAGAATAPYFHSFRSETSLSPSCA